MKKLVFIGLAALICVSCRARNMQQAEPQVQAQATPMMVAQSVEVPQVYTYDPQVEVAVLGQDEDFYRRNIVVKGSGDDYVIYEYSDVRIDKVATLASRYCYEADPQKSAYLRDLYMHKNHKRRATFECVDLASR